MFSYDCFDFFFYRVFFFFFFFIVELPVFVLNLANVSKF